MRYAGLDITDPCPNCDHLLSEHSRDECGCQVGWTYGPHGGPALTDGCECPLAVCD